MRTGSYLQGFLALLTDVAHRDCHLQEYVGRSPSKSPSDTRLHVPLNPCTVNTPRCDLDVDLNPNQPSEPSAGGSARSVLAQITISWQTYTIGLMESSPHSSHAYIPLSLMGNSCRKHAPRRAILRQTHTVSCHCCSFRYIDPLRSRSFPLGAHAPFFQ